jgi:hypothetical protein
MNFLINLLAAGKTQAERIYDAVKSNDLSRLRVRVHSYSSKHLSAQLSCDENLQAANFDQEAESMFRGPYGDFSLNIFQCVGALREVTG